MFMLSFLVRRLVEIKCHTIKIRSITKIGLFLGDRACLSLAKQLELPVVTADRIGRKLTIVIEIEVIR